MAEPLHVPADEWEAVQQRAFDFGWRVGVSQEPDGSFSYAVYSREGKLVQHGTADDWDDARLAMFENLYPPSDEV